MRCHVRLILLSVFGAAPALLGGCASTEGPIELRLAAADYERAFDLALEAARREGLYPELVDRRGGRIETGPRRAGSIVEPWRQDNASFGAALENTLHQQQRRLRFEFIPSDRVVAAFRPDEPLVGTDPTGIGAEMIDLTRFEGDLRLIATVAVERQYRSGVRRGTWTRRQVTTTAIKGPDGDLPATWWTTVARDEALERRILASIDADMARMAGAPVPAE